MALIAALVIAASVLATAVVINDGGSSAPDADLDKAATRGAADVGELAPDFSLPTLDGGTVTLSELRGGPVVVNFWASWCKPCREEFPVLAAALDDHGSAGLAVVGVTFRDIESDSREFADAMGAGWPQGIDDGGTVAATYGVRAIPLTFFLDGDGRITDRIFGGVSEREMDEALERILPS